jgi:hypothetical protein
MLLKPRRPLAPAPATPSKRAEPARCAFCGNGIARPAPLSGPTRAGAGRCACGALFVADTDGKHGGEALVEGLTLLANGDVARAMTLREGADYESRALAYDERSHQTTPGGEPDRYGVSRLWFLKPLHP